MQKAIKLLHDKIQECENMKNWFEKELVRHQHATADQSEVRRLKIALQDVIDSSEEYFDAVIVLSLKLKALNHE